MTTTDETAVEAAECSAPCCDGGPRWTPGERAEQRKRRTEARENAVRLLVLAEEAAKVEKHELAAVLVKIANGWDSVGY